MSWIAADGVRPHRHAPAHPKERQGGAQASVQAVPRLAERPEVSRPGLKDHVCRGPVRACHVDYAGGKGTSIKVSDRFCIPMCDEAHREQTDDLGWPDFDEKYGINALQDSRAFWRLWPSRAVWCAAHPEFEV
jgi:hypothetical protein